MAGKSKEEEEGNGKRGNGGRVRWTNGKEKSQYNMEQEIIERR